MKKMKIEIKNRLTGKILFEYLSESNTIKKTLIRAIENSANLRGADLRDANLCGAYLRDANLGGADLGGAYLGGANLGGADLRDANLGGADLRDANLCGADLRDANLCGADLRGAYLRDANLRGAYLRDAEIDIDKIKHKFTIIPEEGSFIGFKKIKNGCVAKLMIPSEAKRTSNIKNRKCRASEVEVLKIWDSTGKEIASQVGARDGKTLYMVGKTTKPDSYDDNFLEDCTHGIHFFITKQEAIEYN